MTLHLRLLLFFCCLLSRLSSQLPFTPVDTSFSASGIVYPSELQLQVLFQAGDTVWLNGRPAHSKGKLDFMAYLPLNGSEQGYLWINHESTGPDPVLGDGGGASILTLAHRGRQWVQTEPPRAVDFSPVRGSWNNCLGTATPWGTVLTSEEYEPASNAELCLGGQGLCDTSLYQGHPAYQQYGWMVEVEVGTGRVLGKRTAMGRFSHEGALLLADERTVYLLDDYAPGILFKFVAHRPRDLSSGRLYAYQQQGAGGRWLPLPPDYEALAEARRTALSLGASFFLRLEDLVLLPDGRILLTETGKTDVDLQAAIRMGGRPAAHLEPYQQGGRFRDLYGRILVFDTTRLHIRPYLEGGPATQGANHLANPDNLCYDSLRHLLIIHEDINEPDNGRVPAYASGQYYNEVYVLNLRLENPRVDDLNRLLVAPPGAETTGSCFTPDYQHLFINLQHPDPENPRPFWLDTTIVLSGFAH